METENRVVVSCSLKEWDCCDLRRGASLRVQLAVFHSLMKNSVVTR